MKAEVKIAMILAVLFFSSSLARADHYDISYTAGEGVHGSVSASPSEICPNETANVSIDKSDSDLKHYRPAEHDNPDHEAEPKPDETVFDSVSAQWTSGGEGPFSSDQPGDYFFCAQIDDAGTYYDDGPSFVIPCAQVTVNPFEFSSEPTIEGEIVGPQPAEVIENGSFTFKIQGLKDDDTKTCNGNSSPVNDDIKSVRWSATPASAGSIDQNGTFTAAPLKGKQPVAVLIEAVVDDVAPEQGQDDFERTLSTGIAVIPKQTANKWFPESSIQVGTISGPGNLTIGQEGLYRLSSRSDEDTLKDGFGNVIKRDPDNLQRTFWTVDGADAGGDNIELRWTPTKRGHFKISAKVDDDPKAIGANEIGSRDDKPEPSQNFIMVRVN